MTLQRYSANVQEMNLHPVWQVGWNGERTRFSAAAKKKLSHPPVSDAPPITSQLLQAAVYTLSVVVVRLFSSRRQHYNPTATSSACRSLHALTEIEPATLASAGNAAHAAPAPAGMRRMQSLAMQCCLGT